MPSDPVLVRRLKAVVKAEGSQANAARALGISPVLLSRSLAKGSTHLPATRAMLEQALANTNIHKPIDSPVDVEEIPKEIVKQIKQQMPQIAEEVLRYVLKAVQADRAASGEGASHAG